MKFFKQNNNNNNNNDDDKGKDNNKKNNNDDKDGDKKQGKKLTYKEKYVFLLEMAQANLHVAELNPSVIEYDNDAELSRRRGIIRNSDMTDEDKEGLLRYVDLVENVFDSKCSVM